MPSNIRPLDNTAEQLNEALQLNQEAKGLTDMANEWAAMGSDNITVDDLRERAARLNEKSRKIKGVIPWSSRR